MTRRRFGGCLPAKVTRGRSGLAMRQARPATAGVRCDVVAPLPIPHAAGDRVKTDKRDARRLARLHRMGELTPIRVPTVAGEGVRDLCRAREDAIEDRRRARQRLGGMLLRHGRVP